MAQFSPLQSLMENFWATMLAAMISLAFAVSTTLIGNQIKDKTYENAMLRCLGWTQQYIVSISILKISLFFIIPGGLSGLLIAYFLTVQTRNIVRSVSERELILNMTPESVLVGLFVAIVLPLIAMISPTINSLSIQLRDALDIFRSKVETLTVAFTRLQNMYGISVEQVVIGLILSVLGVTIYVTVPFALIQNQIDVATKFLLAIYFVCSISACLIVRQFIPPVSTFLIEFWAWFQAFVMRNDRTQKLKPIIYQNMRTHFHSNQSIGMTFIGIVSFMMYITTLSLGVAALIDASTGRLSGSDISVFSLPSGDASQLLQREAYDKGKMTEFLTQFQAENPFVQGFAFSSFYLDDILNRLQLMANTTEPHLFSSKLTNGFKTLEFKVATADRNHMEIVDANLLQMSEMWQSPSLGKTYANQDVIEMLYDVGSDRELTYFEMHEDPEDVRSNVGNSSSRSGEAKGTK